MSSQVTHSISSAQDRAYAWAASPYPDDARLHRAAQQDLQLVCHQCHGDPFHKADCPACLGSGWIRPCARCYIANQMPHTVFTPCAICCGMHYTAGQSADREQTFNSSPMAAAKRTRSLLNV